MDFQKTTLFVVPAGATLPTTGSTNNLTAGQLGTFRPDYSVATAANIAAAKYIYIAQGRSEVVPGLGSKRSDKLFVNKVIDLYKVTGDATANTQITEVSGFNAKCGETLTLTLRLLSQYINVGFFNGLTRSVTVNTPCCDCGDDPCAEVDVSAIVDDLLAAVNAEPMLSQFITATRSGTGDDSVLVLTGKALTVYGNACDLTAFPYQYDAMNFFTYAYRGAETTQDYNVFDACDLFATTEITRNASYPTGTPDQIRQLEKDYYSYQTTYKSIFSSPLFNGAFTSNVSDSVAAYTTLYIRFYDPKNPSYTDEAAQESMVIIAAPPTEAAAIQTRLELFFGSGAFIDKS